MDVVEDSRDDDGGGTCHCGAGHAQRRSPSVQPVAQHRHQEEVEVASNVPGDHDALEVIEEFKVCF